jgi:uncharacterized protein (DUF433 family)
MNYAQYFTRDPRVCGGQAVFTGTRVTLRTVLASLADGDSADTVLKAYPSLTPDHLRAAIAFAAAAATEDLPPPDPIPSLG